MSCAGFSARRGFGQWGLGGEADRFAPLSYGRLQAPVLPRIVCHWAISLRGPMILWPSGVREYTVPPAVRARRRSFSSSRSARTSTLRSAISSRACRAGMSPSASESTIRIEAFHCPRRACIPIARSHHWYRLARFRSCVVVGGRAPLSKLSDLFIGPSS